MGEKLTFDRQPTIYSKFDVQHNETEKISEERFLQKICLRNQLQTDNTSLYWLASGANNYASSLQTVKNVSLFGKNNFFVRYNIAKNSF